MQGQKSKVFIKRMADWSSSQVIQDALMQAWQCMETSGFSIMKNEFAGIKLTFGEEGNTGYIKPEWISKLVSSLKEKTDNLFILETNTLYREKRSNAVGHLSVARAHGYDISTVGIPIIIADGLMGRSSQTVAIRGDNFDSVKLAKAVCETDALICLSHFTGHMQTGIAGALKNLGMGCASRAGKLQQHSKTLPEIITDRCAGCGECMAVCPANAIGLKKKKALLVKERCIGCGECTVVCNHAAIEIKYDENTVKMQEKVVEYSLGVKKAVGGRLACINLLRGITKNCDCMSKGEGPLVPDIGILASLDPVAIDKASLDLAGKDVFKNIYPDIDPMTQINYGEKIKLGSGQYELIEV